MSSNVVPFPAKSNRGRLGVGQRAPRKEAGRKRGRRATDPGDPGLSFVKRGGADGRDWWGEAPTGDWGDDCCRGEVMAREYLLFERNCRENVYLGWIVREIARKGDTSGLVIGFMREVLLCSKLGLDRRLGTGAP